MRYGSANQYENACSSPVTGSIFGCAVSPLGSGPPKSTRRNVSSSRDSSYGIAPSVSDKMRPACPSTLVLLESYIGGAGPDTGSAPIACAIASVRTQRLRYHVAPTVTEVDAVHHAVTHEPVVRPFRPAVRVRAGAQVLTLQLGRDLPDDGQVGGGRLFRDRPVVAGEKRVLGQRHERLLSPSRACADGSSARWRPDGAAANTVAGAAGPY